MRRVSPNAFLMPSAVTVMGTLASEGVVDFSTMSSVGVVCLTPAIVAVGSSLVKPPWLRGPGTANAPGSGSKRSGYSPSDGNRSRKAWVTVTMTSRGSPWLRTSMPDSVSARGSSVAS